MTNQLHKIDAAQNQHPAGSPGEPADLSAVTHVEDDSAVSHSVSGRALRNWLVLANIAAWIVIIVAVKLLFF